MVKERLELEKIADTTSPLIHFEIHRYYQNEHHGNGFYSINNLLTIKDRTYVQILMIMIIPGLIGSPVISN